ncbi:MAG: rubrerythrin family protein [Chloroflexota bacterium]
MGSTADNLQSAFAGESQANRKYLFFAEQAAKEGYPQVARLFRAVAEAETVHARNHLGVLGGIGATKDNVAAAIKGEHYEFTQMYPGFIKQAKEEGDTGAGVVLDYANKVEKVHHQLYQKAEAAVTGGPKLAEEPYYVCQVCGYTVAGKAPDRCPICGSPREKFKKIE